MIFGISCDCCLSYSGFFTAEVRVFTHLLSPSQCLPHCISYNLGGRRGHCEVAKTKHQQPIQTGIYLICGISCDCYLPYTGFFTTEVRVFTHLLSPSQCLPHCISCNLGGRRGHCEVAKTKHQQPIQTGINMIYRISCDCCLSYTGFFTAEVRVFTHLLSPSQCLLQ